MNKKRASSTIYIIFFFVIFLAFAAFAVDGAIVFTNRVKLQEITEQTAIAVASKFNYSGTISQDAQDTFNLLKQGGLQTATATFQVKTAEKKILVISDMVAQPFFLSFLGVSGINLEAKACAISEPLSVTANYSGINWVTASAAYLSDILSKNVNLNDTAILTPLGNFNLASYYNGIVDFSLINEGGNSLSLGPGGFITIKLPAPIVDKPGDDLYIKEAGDALEGYMVFAGLDIDPANPYVQNGKEGAGISWINITASGNSIDLASPFGTAGTQLPTAAQTKFYGSGSFDIGKSGISMAKYIRIIDDNSETGFVKGKDGNYYKTMLYGEASTATAGADIDSVQVLNHVKLIPASSF